MNSAAERRLVPFTPFEQLREGRSVLQKESAALQEVSRRLDSAFCAACQLLCDCEGSVIVTGMGKAGLVGHKVAATLSSTGTRAHFLHPAEAVHGDIGCLHPDDVLLALSNSGETEEISRILPIVRRVPIPIIAVTATDTSTLGSQAEVTIRLGRLRESDAYGLAPTASTTAMLAVGDALALVVSRMRGFTPQQFAVFHPAGSLGRRLKRVGDVMRHGEAVRIARDDATIRDVFVALGKPGRRTGAVMLVDPQERLTGVFTDSDLARLLEQRREAQLDRPIAEAMTRNPLTVDPEALVEQALDLLSARKLSELPVVDSEGRPVGLIDITDLIGLAADGGSSRPSL